MTRRDHALYWAIIAVCLIGLTVMTVWTRTADAQQSADCETFDLEPAPSVWSPDAYDLIIVGYDNGTGAELFDVAAGQRIDAPDGLEIVRLTKCTYLDSPTPTPTPESPTPSPTPEPSSTPEPTPSPSPQPTPSPGTTPTPTGQPTPTPTPDECVYLADLGLWEPANCEPKPTPTPPTPPTPKMTPTPCTDPHGCELPRTGTGLTMPLTIAGSTLLAAGTAILRGRR